MGPEGKTDSKFSPAVFTIAFFTSAIKINPVSETEALNGLMGEIVVFPN